MVAGKYVEAPTAILDYQINWAPYLSSPPAAPGDTLATSVWAMAALNASGGTQLGTEITLTFPSFTTTTATVTVALNTAAGGVKGIGYNVDNTITTVGGRKTTRTITFEFLYPFP